jgi:hypothetical protein
MTIETKYNIGDEVWFMGGSQIFCGRICCVVIWRDIYSYQVEFEKRLYNLFEDSLFPTKEELLKSL